MGVKTGRTGVKAEAGLRLLLLLLQLLREFFGRTSVVFREASLGVGDMTLVDKFSLVSEAMMFVVVVAVDVAAVFVAGSMAASNMNVCVTMAVVAFESRLP